MTFFCYFSTVQNSTHMQFSPSEPSFNLHANSLGRTKLQGKTIVITLDAGSLLLNASGCKEAEENRLGK